MSTDGEFIDPEYDIPRRNDAEQKIIELMKEDIARLSEQLGIPYDELKVNVKIESTYTPCNICQRDLYLFQEQFKANIEIAVVSAVVIGVDRLGYFSIAISSFCIYCVVIIIVLKRFCDHIPRFLTHVHPHKKVLRFRY